MEARGESRCSERTHPLQPYLAQLHEQGAVVIPDFFSVKEMAEPIQAIHGLFAKVAASVVVAHPLDGPDIREFPADTWFDSIDFPYSTISLNLIGCHREILSVAREALRSSQVLMHYNYVSAKFAASRNYSQPLHLDSPMHSFFSPSDDPRYSALNCVLYLSDVDEGCGPLSYLPKPRVSGIPYGKITLDHDENMRMSVHEVVATGRAGSLLMYFHDTYHRGTNLTTAGASRYQLVASFHAGEASTFIGGSPWPRAALTADWNAFLPYASVEQLSAIGIPPPGHEFWTDRILDELSRRFSGWDLSGYRLLANRE